MYEEYSTKQEWVTEEMLDEIKYAMERQEGLGIPMFKQDFAYRLVKLNQVDKTMWETDFVTKVYKMVEELEAAENNMLAKEHQNAHTSGLASTGAKLRNQRNK